MPLKKDNPDELLQFDPAMVAIKAGDNAETLTKLLQFANRLNQSSSGMMNQHGMALAPAVAEKEKGLKPKAFSAKNEEPNELLQFDAAFVAIKAGKNAEMHTKLLRFANELTQYATGMMEHVTEEEEKVKPESLGSKKEKSVVKEEEEMHPPPVTSSALEADVAASTDAAPDAARKGQAKDEQMSPSSDNDRDDDAGQRKRKRDELSSNDGEVKTEAIDTGNDSDDASVEDVSDKIAADKEASRKARAQDDVISIHDSSDENESLFESDNETLDSEDAESEDDDSEYEDDSESNDEKKRKAGKKKPILPFIHVKMNPRDVPTAPGCDESRLSEESDPHSLMDVETSFRPTTSKDEAVKARVLKLLNTGYHKESNENEAKNAMRLAQKLIQRHNLSQVLLMKERDIADKKSTNPESLNGGMATVYILNAKTQKPSPFYNWTRILGNALAAYAFKVATERVSVMMQEYSTNVKIRTTYARGIARGLSREVEEVKRQEEEKRKAKLEKARLSVRNGEAYEESDDDSDDEDDDDDSQEGAGFAFAETASSPAAASDESAEAESSAFASPTATDSNAPTAAAKDAAKDDKESAAQRLERLEKREEAALALVDHHEQVAKDVLKEKNIKLRTARKMTLVDTKSKAYGDGLKDSSQLDINQRAIRNGVKKEKTAA